MDESRKSTRYFNEFEASILSKSVMDIGAGQDPVVKHAQIFDQAQGDANTITRYVSSQFDCVYSSHCLEHMLDPAAALKEWWQLVKPGGYLFFIVPDEDLYEQGVFPSRFNGDHKHTFTLSKKKSWSPVSINVLDLIRTLADAEVISVVLNDIGLERRFIKHGSFRTGAFSRFIVRQIKSCKKRGVQIVPKSLENYFFNRSLIDQTQEEGLAQLEVILKKRSSVH